jgi:hypothetical protein
MKNGYTLNPIPWLQYAAWTIQWWMQTHRPIYPLWFRVWALKHYGNERSGLTWDDIRRWETVRPDYKHPHKPVPWYIGAHGLGPLYAPWLRIARFVRRFTGGRSHRCEFTDREMGALYGHQHGAFMDRLFEVFIDRISLR